MKRGTPVLYHYTSLDGFVGILRDRAIWASSIRHLSDSSEFRYTLELVEKRVLAMPKGASGSYGTFLDSYRTAFAGMADGTVYVASFSSEGDLLSQWRAYGNPGGTIALGLRRTGLEEAASASGYTLTPCLYDRAKQLRELQHAFAAAVALGDTMGPGLFANRVLSLAPTMKHRSFLEEAEWRFISPRPAPGDLLFRSSGSLLVPYRVVPLNGEKGFPLSEVVLGPNPHPYENLLAVRLLLAENGLGAARVRQSKAPFRVR